jgi:hypothetical protein
MEGEHSIPTDWVKTVGAIMLFGILLLVGAAFRDGIENFAVAIRSAVWSVLLALCAALLGGLVGFLFGIPRSLQASGPVQDASSTSDAGTSKANTERVSVAGYRSNTNLEQISDWLTKILVGVGLIQFPSIWENLQKAGTYFGPSISLDSAASAVSDAPSQRLAVLIILVFCVCGFFYTYLWTVLILIGRMTEAERESVVARERKAEQADIDARAIAMVDAVLKGAAIPQNQLKAVIEKASNDATQLMFYRASEIRRNNWRSDKVAMERTIPIFEALISLDTRNEYYELRGQLAYALRDRQNASKSDIERALGLFDTAIRMRDQQGGVNEFYEFSRAMCRIALDPTETGLSKSPLRERIMRDLTLSRNIAARADDPLLSNWLERNNLRIEDLSLQGF